MMYGKEDGIWIVELERFVLSSTTGKEPLLDKSNDLCFVVSLDITPVSIAFTV